MSESKLYCGIGLNATKSCVLIADEKGRTVLREKFPHRLDAILERLEPHRHNLVGVAVESSLNWYWLVDGLMEAGYDVRLVSPSPNLRRKRPLRRRARSRSIPSTNAVPASAAPELPALPERAISRGPLYLVK